MEGKPYAANAGRVYEDFEPSEEWAREEAHDTIMVYIPGFRKENLRIQVTSSRNIRVLGERPLGHDNKWQRFRKEFPIPSHCDTNDISAKFESGVLYVKLPKMIAPVVEIKDKLHKPPTQTPKPPAGALKAPKEAPKPPTEAPKPQKPISTGEPAQPQKTRKSNGPSEAVNGNGNYVPPRTMEKEPISTQSSKVNSSTNHVEAEGKNFAHKALDKVKIATKSTEKLEDDGAKRAEESTKEEYKRAIFGEKNTNAGGGDQCSRRPQGGYYKYKQVLSGLVMEMKQQPRKMVNLGLAVFFVLVLGLYAKQAINSIQGFKRAEL